MAEVHTLLTASITNNRTVQNIVTTLQTMWNSLMVCGTPPWHYAC